MATIKGTSAPDALNGTTGADTIDGGAGADTMAGGPGDDIYIVDDPADKVVETSAADGYDIVRSSVSFTLGAHLEKLVLTGSRNDGTGNALANIIVGTSGSNRLDGGGGADTLIGGGGGDVYSVDNPGDVIIASGGWNTVLSSISYTLAPSLQHLVLTGTGAINGTGNAHPNQITGNGADNILDGARSAGGSGDTLTGKGGNDTYILRNRGDKVIETVRGGIDHVKTPYDYTLPEHVENLTLIGTGDVHALGNEGPNRIIGNSGDNTLWGKGGADILAGGPGNDHYLADWDDRLIERAGEGIDTISIRGSYTLPSHFENLRIIGGNDVRAVGNASANKIEVGTLGGGTLLGLGGSDRLRGGAGNDLIDGGTGADTMTGGEGNDTFIVDNLGDKVVEDYYTGTDLVRSSVSFVLGPNVDHLVLTGAAATNGTGNVLVNKITGNSAANVLDGKAGPDILSGLGGNDTYVVDDAHDKIIETATRGSIDTIRTTVSYVLGAGVRVERLTAANPASTGPISLYGNEFANALSGNAGSNTLDGKGGADTMTGFGGNDDYYVDSAGDVVVEAARGGTDLVTSSVSYTLPANVENLVLTGAKPLTGTGNGGRNEIQGNDGANVLDGKAGADLMQGGGGNDTYVVDNPGDVVREFGQLDDVDTVLSSVTFALALEGDVENLQLTGTAAIDGTGDGQDNIIIGNGAANVLRGLDGADRIDGGGGNDSIYGGFGADILTGGAGADRFYFENFPFLTVTAIQDFVVGEDKIYLVSSPSFFGVFLYDQAGGNIFLATSTTADPILFATVTPGTPLTSADVIVI